MDYIEHFKVKIRKSERNKLTRENYCIPTNKPCYAVSKNLKIAKVIVENQLQKPLIAPDMYFDIPNEKYADYEHYTDDWVKKHYSDCMENFDLNMKYFDGINYNDFNNYLNSYVKKNKFKQVFDLSELKDVIGVYIIVLDRYKQVYIGISNNIKRRILNHWSKKKDFDRLIYGSKDNSVISIDSFGALDTTRVFYKESKWHQDSNELEEKYVNSFEKQYLINRVSGGINGEVCKPIRELRLMGSINKRQLQ